MGKHGSLDVKYGGHVSWYLLRSNTEPPLLIRPKETRICFEAFVDVFTSRQSDIVASPFEQDIFSSWTYNYLQ